MPTICIFAASSSACDAKYFQWTRETAGLLAAQGWDLVFGGSDMGLMSAMANVFKEHSRHVTSVIPHAFDNRCRPFPESDEIIKVDNLRLRKHEMADRADAFLALTGGCGTLDEFLEMVTLKHLDMAPQKLVLFNPEDYWGPFLQMLDRMDSEGFSPRPSRSFFSLAATPEEVASLIADR